MTIPQRNPHPLVRAAAGPASLAFVGSRTGRNARTSLAIDVRPRPTARRLASIPCLCLAIATSIACGGSSGTHGESPPGSAPAGSSDRTTTPERPPPPSHEGHASHSDCPDGFECTVEQICSDGECIAKVQIGWKDTNDAGDDPFHPGCHWFYYDDPTCQKEPQFFRPDTCIDVTHLHEYTDPACHVIPPLDEKDYDCDQLCKDQGSPGGQCVTVPNVCDGKPSAKCECVVVEP